MRPLTNEAGTLSITVFSANIYLFKGNNSNNRNSYMHRIVPFLHHQQQVSKGEQLQCITGLQPFNDQCPSHLETSQLICRANQLTSFYMRGTLVAKGLNAKCQSSFLAKPYYE